MTEPTSATPRSGTIAAFRDAHRRELTAAWGASVGFVLALLGLQPGWQTDVVSTLVLGLAAVATGVRFALTPEGRRLIEASCGEGLVRDAIHHGLALAHRWRQAGAAQPAWR